MHLFFFVAGGASWSVFTLKWSALGIMILLSIVCVLAWNIFSSSQAIDPRGEFKQYIALVHERYDSGVDDVIFPWLPLISLPRH